MKESQYNFFVPYKERIICFNAVSGKIFSIDKNKEFKAIKKTLNEGKTENPLATFLYNNKFMIDTDTDETDLFKLENRISVFDNNYHLAINPTLECNFNCWYCYEKSIKGFMSIETQNRIKLLIKKIITKEKVKKLTISWFGGEPLLYLKDVIYPISLYAMELCKKNNVSFSNNATTNGYLLSEENLSLIDQINLDFFQITIDGKPEEHNKVRNQNGKPSFDKIIENIISVCEKIPSSKIVLRINYTNKVLKNDFQEILNVIPHNLRKQIRINFQRVWQTRNQKDKENLLSGIETISKMNFAPDLCGGFSIGKQYNCYVDRFRFAHINFDGKIYRCTARDYSEEYVCGELNSNGDIIWKPGINEQMFIKANFDNDECLPCKLLPICTGPCFQNYKDYKRGKANTFCFQKDKEVDVEDFIIQYYLQTKTYNNVT